MPKDQFKTRLEIAKKKILKKNHHNKDDNPSSIGTAFKLSTELVAAVAVGTIIGFIFDQTYRISCCSGSWDNYWVYF